MINLHDNVVLTKDLPGMIGLCRSAACSRVEIVVKLQSKIFSIQADDIDDILYLDDMEQCPIEEELI